MQKILKNSLALLVILYSFGALITDANRTRFKIAIGTNNAEIKNITERRGVLKHLLQEDLDRSLKLLYSSNESCRRQQYQAEYAIFTPYYKLSDWLEKISFMRHKRIQEI